VAVNQLGLFVSRLLSNTQNFSSHQINSSSSVICSYSGCCRVQNNQVASEESSKILIEKPPESFLLQPGKSLVHWKKKFHEGNLPLALALSLSMASFGRDGIS
jgi:hypothetical protein